MKSVRELSREQMEELKQNYLSKKMDEKGESPSYGELAEASTIITDEEMWEVYGDTEFSDDDFTCSAGSDASNEHEKITAWIMEGMPGQFLHINCTEDGDGTWFDWTPVIWCAYWMKSLEDLKNIAKTEFSDFPSGYPKFHKYDFSYQKRDEQNL